MFRNCLKCKQNLGVNVCGKEAFFFHQILKRALRTLLSKRNESIRVVLCFFEVVSQV